MTLAIRSFLSTETCTKPAPGMMPLDDEGANLPRGAPKAGTTCCRGGGGYLCLGTALGVPPLLYYTRSNRV